MFSQSFMKIKSSLFAASLAYSVSILHSHAAVTYTSGTYQQTFDSLSGVSTWSNNSTLAGWYAATTNTSSITAIGTGSGSTTTPAGLYSFGTAGTNAVTEKALGFYASNSFTGSSGTGVGRLGLQISNGTAYSLNQFTLSYDGEQWRRDNASANTITVEYSLNATSLTTGTWVTAGSSLNFTSPQLSATALVLDGNAPANRVAGLTATITSIDWAPGTEIWIRFNDLNDSGNDHTLAIDNVNFTAIPEPDVSALIGAVGILGIFRRRR